MAKELGCVGPSLGVTKNQEDPHTTQASMALPNAATGNQWYKNFCVQEAEPVTAAQPTTRNNESLNTTKLVDKLRRRRWKQEPEKEGGMGERSKCHGYEAIDDLTYNATPRTSTSHHREH
ncbi:hypothetical protein F2Q70_00016915 [Brassica cretica]|uniref:Uncharacterized protein n=1 Tax=Brassica cretica TaxID=69181 RepID=A0A8S9KQN7_BRACR|nr:hypothetical protein F2Q70_00016915 [Brassica cretica]KAF2595748.1 hypothetical protein F2Q68_00009880 [Brassica cretica]